MSEWHHKRWPPTKVHYYEDEAPPMQGDEIAKRLADWVPCFGEWCKMLPCKCRQDIEAALTAAESRGYARAVEEAAKVIDEFPGLVVYDRGPYDPPGNRYATKGDLALAVKSLKP